MFKRILFAHNATPAAERAMLYLEHLARVEEAEVVVLHVYQVPDQYNAMQGYEGLLSTLESLAHEVVDDAIAHLDGAGIKTQGLVLAGLPAQRILETAGEQQVSLIVLGTRGPSSVKEFLVGDVTTEVLRYAPCPVMLVP
ncbi:MAG: universal stress protein [Anaerolineae bacterium]|jgi:nucleotide-binding universal stress UspA family protein|nr:universal stress protein [Anaerolineae bacterium]